jgi:hypothetical protein
LPQKRIVSRLWAGVKAAPAKPVREKEKAEKTVWSRFYFIPGPSKRRQSPRETHCKKKQSVFLFFVFKTGKSCQLYRVKG